MAASLPITSARDDYRWAEHLIYLEGGDEDGVAARPASRAALRAGLALCILVAVAAGLLERAASQSLGGLRVDAATLAMILGVVLANTGVDSAAVRPGARWVVRVVLPLGIVLLGARLQLADLLALGVRGLSLSVFVIGLSAAALFAFARWRGLSGRMATLLAVGNGICGGSAVLAVAPAIRANEEEVAASVSALALLGLIGMLVLPGLGLALGMDAVAFGTWSGLAIQQTPQVIAAGFAHGAESGEVATVVKLVRVSMLAPVVLIVGLAYRRRFEPGSQRGGLQLRGIVPGFVIGLLVLAAITSVGFLPQITIEFASGSMLGAFGATLHIQALAIGASKVCLVLAMAAVGLETRWEALRKAGPTALGAAAFGAAVVVTASAVAVSLF